MSSKKLTQNIWENLVNEVDTIMLDCDGVLWLGETVIKGAPEAIAYMKRQNKRVLLLTNNSTKSRRSYVEKCLRLGFCVDDEESIITPSHLAADYFQNISGFNGHVYIVGSSGIGHELDAIQVPHTGIGPDPFDSKGEIYASTKLDPKVKAVVVGFDFHFSYPKLLKAASYLKNPDCLFIATNEDETIPESAHENLTCPGTGCIVAAVSVAANRKPIVLGKPSKYVFDYVKRRFNIDPAKTLMVGDRIGTDIQLATKFGMHSLMVETGVHKYNDLMKQEFASMLPEFYTQSIGDILNL